MATSKTRQVKNSDGERRVLAEGRLRGRSINLVDELDHLVVGFLHDPQPSNLPPREISISSYCRGPLAEVSFGLVLKSNYSTNFKTLSFNVP